MPHKVTYVYSHVEDAAVLAFGEVAKSRLNRMTSEKLFPRPGRDGLVKYGEEEISNVVLAMALADLGVPMQECARLLKRYGKLLHRRLRREDFHPETRFLHDWIHSDWAQKVLIRWHPGTGATPPVDVVSPERTKELIDQLMSPQPVGGPPAQVSVTDLTPRLRAMAEALQQTKPRLRGRPKAKPGVTRKSRAAAGG